MCTHIAQASGTTAHVEIKRGYDVTFNDEKLTMWSVPVLQQAVGAENVHLVPYRLGSEDFSCYQKKFLDFSILLDVVLLIGIAQNHLQIILRCFM